ncbi:MAG: hypothetical protein KBT35_01665 [Firmicutes bacterium]|nr:hypothetical protein [Candidatus Colivicinus equi]
MYILDEEKYINQLLDTYKKPDDLSVLYLITLISKYYINKYDNINNLVDKVKKEISLFNISGYQEYFYASKIYNICSEMFVGNTKKEFKKLEYIPIYSSDLEIINTLPSDKYKKLMFTLIANARYMDSSGWINKKTSDGIREIFKQANISGGDDLRDSMLHDLYKNGYISFARANMNQNIKINHFEHNEDVVYKVTDFNHLGNQYLGNFKKGYMMCKNCWKIIRCTGNKKMYCKKCAEDMIREKTRERVRLFREK